MFKHRRYRNPKDYGLVPWQAVLDQPYMVDGVSTYAGLTEWALNNLTAEPAQDSADTGASVARAPGGIIPFGPDGGYALYTQITTTTTAQAGARTFRTTESQRNDALYYYAEFAIPYVVTVSNFYNIEEFKTRLPAGTNLTSWFLDVINPEAGVMALRLVYPNDMPYGPFPGLPGGVNYFFYQVDPLPLPVNEWFSLEVYLKPSEDWYTGEIAVWQTILGETPVPLVWDIGGTHVHRVHGIATNQPLGLQMWAITDYGRNLLANGSATIAMYNGKCAISTAPISGTRRQPQRDKRLCYVTQDTWLSKANPTVTHGSDEFLRCHSSAAALGKIAIMRFNLAHLAGRTVSSDGALDLHNVTVAGANRDFAVHRMIANAGWTAGSTWDYVVPSTTRWAGDSENNGGDNAGGSVAGTDYETTALATFTYTASNPANTLHRVTIAQATLQDAITDGYIDIALLGTSANDFDWRSSDYITDPRYRPLLIVPVVG